jgi:pyruvate dehydrogenase E1 component beta subunit
MAFCLHYLLKLTYRIQKEGSDYLDAPIRRICSADAPMHYAPNLAALAIPDVARYSGSS